MKTQQGFTLIELVVVVVILGILSVVAAPKLIGISSDAQKSAIKGLHSTIKTSFDTIYLKARILDATSSPGLLDSKSSLVDLGFAEIYLIFGKPLILWPVSISKLVDNTRYLSSASVSTICDSQGQDFCAIFTRDFESKSQNIIIFPDNYSVEQNCYVQIFQDTDNDHNPISPSTRLTATGTSYNHSGC